MKRYVHTLIPLLATILLMVAGVSCVEPLYPDEPTLPDGQDLTLRIYLPAMNLTTKTDPSPVTADDDEKKLKDLQVWIFTHVARGDASRDAEGAVAYLSLGDMANVGTSGTLDVTIRIPDYVMQRSADQLKFDIIALGNARSIGLTLNDMALRKINRGDLMRKAFGDNDGSGFGSKLIQKVPETGLPMACYFDNDGAGFDISFLNLGFTADQLKAIQGFDGTTFDLEAEKVVALKLTDGQKTFIQTYGTKKNDQGVLQWYWEGLFVRTCPQLEMTRSVTKVNFIFSKIVDFKDQTEITSIEISDFPDASFVIPRADGAISLPSAVQKKKIIWGDTNPPLLKNNEIAEIDNPLRLCGDSTIPTYDEESGKAPKDMSADEYQKFLKREIAKGNATLKTLYLRESDARLKGVITYRKGDEINKKASFDFQQKASSFPRNTVWTVYAYYVSYGLHIHVTVNPWTGTSNTGQHLKK